MDEESSNASSEPAGTGSRASLDAVEIALRELRHRGPELVFRALLVVVFVALVAPMAMPLVLGAMAAMVLFPANERFRARFPRLAGLAPSVVTLATVVIVLVPLFWVGWNTVAALRSFVQGMLSSGDPETRARFADAMSRLLGRSASEAELASTIEDAATRAGTVLAQWLGAVVKAVPEGVTNTFLFLLALYFALRDGPMLVAFLRRISPVRRERTDQLFAAVQRSVYGTMMGMLAVAAVQGSLAMLALFACRVPHAFLWGVIAAIASAIPIVGTTPVTFGAAGYLFLHDRPVAALAMIASAIVIGVSDNVVRPWVQSAHDDIHPLLALLALFGGLAVFGPAGLVLGPLLASMAIWAVDTYRD